MSRLDRAGSTADSTGGAAALDDILPHECAQLSPGRTGVTTPPSCSCCFRSMSSRRSRWPASAPRRESVSQGRVWHSTVSWRLLLGAGLRGPIGAADRTRDFSDDMAARDALLERIGDEAQWCLFDPIVSAYYGRRFLAPARADIEQQTLHFNRALAQITASWRCPELYCLRRRRLRAEPASAAAVDPGESPGGAAEHAGHDCTPRRILRQLREPASVDRRLRRPVGRREGLV